MTGPPMDPQYEQMLRDEVIYLHSLWHQGPPRPAAAPADAAAPHHLQPLQSTHFKSEGNPKPKNKKKKKNKNKPNDPTPESNSSPGIEWPCPATPPPPATTGWPSFPAQPDPKPTVSFSPEEKSTKNAQQRALAFAQQFFKGNNSNTDSDGNDSGDSDEDDDMLMEEDDGREEYSFFLKLLMEDDELRGYYEKNFAQGVFNCLVCGAVGGKKMGKKYKGCLALVQHSITISKTKKRRAHRAYGQAVCKVLGWDIDQLPTIVSLLSELMAGESQGDVDLGNKESSITGNVDAVEGNSARVVPESEHGSSHMEGNVDFDNKESSITPVSNACAVEGNGGVVVQEVESGAAVSLSSENIPIQAQNLDIDIKESSNTSVCNVESVENNNNNNGVVVPENAALGPGVAPTGDEGNLISGTCQDGDELGRSRGFDYWGSQWKQQC